VRAVALVALAAVALVAAAIVIGNTVGGGTTSVATVQQAPFPNSHGDGRSGHRGSHRDPHRPGGSANADPAVNRTLGYTPFIVRGVPRHRVIALTFDDGPSPYTQQVVSVLVRMHVPATFFVVGQQLRYFAAGLRDELRHGFVIGDHTQNHAWLIRLPAAGQYDQIQSDALALQRLGAPAPRLFRPPYGAFDATTFAILRRLRMLMVLWSIDPSDWRRPGVRAIVQNVLANSRPGAIVIMHDGGGNRAQTVAALPYIVNGLRRRGYQLVTVPQLLALDPPPRHQKAPELSGV
jgi:peptidoglycan-N-acetylglucosamine deacetylase